MNRPKRTRHDCSENCPTPCKLHICGHSCPIPCKQHTCNSKCEKDGDCQLFYYLPDENKLSDLDYDEEPVKGTTWMVNKGLKTLPGDDLVDMILHLNKKVLYLPPKINKCIDKWIFLRRIRYEP